MQSSIRTAWGLATCVVLLLPAVLHAAEPPSTLEQIRKFNPWLSEDDPLQLPLKIHSLMQDEYTFFRGTADLYYDLCKKSWTKVISRDAPFITLHGDVHLGNIGTYRAWTSHGAAIRFGIVDLDETFQGPFELDVARALVAIRLIASQNQIDLAKPGQTDPDKTLLEGYARALTGRAAADDAARRHPIVQKLIKKANKGEPGELAGKFCTGEPPRRFRSVRMKKGHVADIMIQPDAGTRAAFEKAVFAFLDSDGGRPVLARWLGRSPDKSPIVADIARWTRIGSGGSQGVHKYLVLLRAVDDAAPPLLLQFKEEPVPAAERAGLGSTTSGPERAAKVAAAYDALLEDPCWLVGHAIVEGRGYLIRTKDPFSEEPSVEDIKTYDDIMAASALLGETLGRAHRTALKRRPDGDAAIDYIVEQLGAPMRLHLLCSMTEVITRSAYENLRNDPAARKLVQIAEKRIKEAAGARGN